jgi:DNA primase
MGGYVRFDMEQIKAGVSIESVLSEVGITLRNGRCKCPVHAGQNPSSFSVSKGFFHCFSCGISGDCITLVQKLYNLDFKQAVEYVAKKAGLSTNLDPVQRRERAKSTSVADSDGDLGKTIQEAVIDLEESYVRVLKQLDKDLKSRKISLSQYYARQNTIDYRLEDLDQFSIKQNYERNMRRKEKWKKTCLAK